MFFFWTEANLRPTSSERYRTKSARTLDEGYGKQVKIYTDESKMGDKTGYVIVKEEHTIKKRIVPQWSMRSSLQLLEQSNRRKIADTK
jgi:hypothetical protein